MKNLLIENTYDKLCFLGDIHGEFDYINYLIRVRGLKNTVLIQVGDFGIGYYKHERDELKYVNEALVKKNALLLVVRGNHDDPSYFNNQYYMSNIVLVEDYTVVSLVIRNLKRNILFIGGAVSIDRMKSISAGKKYWPEEVCDTRMDPAYLDQFKNIHYLVTHTAHNNVEPFFLSPIVYHFAHKDDKLLDDLRNERNNLTVVLDHIIRINKDTLKEHYYGHFHFSATTFVGGVMHYLLKINEFKEANVKKYNNIDDYDHGAKPDGDRDQTDD